MAEEVGAFSGLGEFLDVPVRTYSAGMRCGCPSPWPR